ncbi:MAG: polysaccharide biosynthesis protein [Bergeyella sp.]|nr:polysaccharide biosynthesis protein [Bergeyella sp.]
MEVIARQSVKYSIIGYAGSLIGTLSLLFLFSRNFEFYGKLRNILTQAEFVVPFIVLGVSFSNVKFFSQTQKEKKEHSLLSLSLISVLITFSVFFVGLHFASREFPYIKNLKLWEYKFFTLPLILILSLSSVFNKFTSNYKRIAVANIFDNTFPKIANILAFSLFYFMCMPESFSLSCFVLVFLLGLSGYIFYTRKLSSFRPDLSTHYFFGKGLWKEFLQYSFFAFLGTFGNYFTINNAVVGQFLGNEKLGIFSTYLGLLSLISIPQLGVYTVSAPLITRYLEDKEYLSLNVLYKTTSLSLFFLGVLMFSCMIAGIPYLFTLMKNGQMLHHHQFAFYIWGLAILVDLSTGFNSNIISLSEYYKFNILAMIASSIMNIVLDLYFVYHTNYGLKGIAAATAVSLVFYNTIKVVFNYKKFGVFPFSIKMFWTLLLGILAVGIGFLIPEAPKPFLNLVYKPFFVLVFILLGNYFLKILPIQDFLNIKFLKSIMKFR